MPIEFDLSHVGKPEDIHKGFERVEPGCGMALISEFNEYGHAKTGAHELKLEIVAWTVDDSVGQIHEELIFTKDTSGKGWPLKRMTALALASGVWRVDQVKQWQMSGQQGSLETQDMVGRPIFVELVEEPDQSNPAKTYIKVGGAGLAFFNLNDPACANWPKNQALFNQWAPKVGTVAVSTSHTSSLPTQSKQELPAASDPFSNV